MCGTGVYPLNTLRISATPPPNVEPPPTLNPSHVKELWSKIKWHVFYGPRCTKRRRGTRKILDADPYESRDLINCSLFVVPTVRYSLHQLVLKIYPLLYG